MPYVLDDSVSPTDLEALQGGINLLQEKTCLRIIPRTNEENYILIKTNDKDRGCFSQVGMRGGSQVLNLDREGCTIASTAAHELLHAAGLDHEQARADRDEFIFVDYQNVCKENRENYDRCNDTGIPSEDCSSYGFNYNVKSIMHYMGLVTDRNFAVDPTKPIMTSRDPNNPIPDTGNDQLTEEDAGKINLIYNNCNGNPK